MRRLETHRWRALLVVVLLGFTALTLHTSIHAQPDQPSCELCGGHVNPGHAIAAVTETPVLMPAAAVLVWFPQQTAPSEPFTSYHQRAPPVLN